MNVYLAALLSISLLVSVCLGTVLYMNYGYQYLVKINRTECWNVMCMDVIQGCMFYENDSCCSCHIQPHLGGKP